MLHDTKGPACDMASNIPINMNNFLLEKAKHHEATILQPVMIGYDQFVVKYTICGEGGSLSFHSTKRARNAASFIRMTPLAFNFYSLSRDSRTKVGASLHL
jgi:hypothetical protein